MIINGYFLSMFNNNKFLYYLIKNDVKLKDFKEFANSQTSLLCNHIEDYIKSSGVHLQYLYAGKQDKDGLARETHSHDPTRTGLVAAFSAVELCKTTTVVPNRETHKLEVGCRTTKCKHYYLYYNDDEFGWMYFKIQTWFPYNAQIYINGREYLSRILDRNGIKHEMYGNSFSYVEDFDKAQELADNILNKKMSDSFDGIAKKINNLLPNVEGVFNTGYYWVIDQCEFATDINFKNREDLANIFKPLVETAFFTFSSRDIYSFFGRKISHIHTFTKGEIVSDLRYRYQGYRIKFKINNNQVKMYDKGNNLRIEVTINNPKDFKVLKTVVDQDEAVESKKWVPMGKSVANLYRYVEISKSIINRYMNALPDIDADRLPVKAVSMVSTRKFVDGKPFSAFNILSGETLNLFVALSDGAYLINGFNNRLIRQKIFSDPESKKCIGKTTRLFAKLKAHKIIKKVPGKNRYYLTVSGRKIINSILLFTNRTLLNIG
jgi:hypothetical protein